MAQVSFAGFSFELAQTFNPRFGHAAPNLSERTLDGAWLHDGHDAARVLPGRLVLEFVLRSYTRAGMQVLRDQVVSLQSQGLQWLTYTPSGGGGRRCMALVTGLDMREDLAGQSELQQRGSIRFVVPDPRWLRHAQTNAMWYLGQSGLPRLNGMTAAGYRVGRQAGSTLNDSLAAGSAMKSITMTNAGTATTTLSAVVIPAEDTDGLVLERLRDGVAEDRVSTGRQLPASAELYVDGSRGLVLVSGDNVIGDGSFSYRHPLLLRLLPGANTVRVQRSSTSGAVTLYFRWDNAWR